MELFVYSGNTFMFRVVSSVDVYNNLFADYAKPDAFLSAKIQLADFQKCVAQAV